MYSVFGCPSMLILIVIIIIIILYGRNEPFVRYCFLWLLCGRERFVQYCFLWRSCADAGCHVYVPWVYHLAAKQGCTDVRVWLPKLGGLNIFCAHVLRGYLWASPTFFFFFFLSTVGIELTFFLYKNIYSRKLARFARGVLIHATGLSRESILWFAWACLHVRVKGGRRRRAAG